MDYKYLFIYLFIIIYLVSTVWHIDAWYKLYLIYKLLYTKMTQYIMHSGCTLMLAIISIIAETFLKIVLWF